MTFKDDITDERFDELCKAMAKLSGAKEIRQFLRDLCTRAELSAMGERWEIAQYVRKGVPYRSVAKKTGASTTTVTRVAQWLHHGMGGYNLMLDRAEKHRPTAIKTKKAAA